MALDPEQFQKIYNAIVEGYNKAELTRMVLFEMGEKLDRITKQGTLRDQVFELVEWADRTGRERELVQAAYNGNPTYSSLKMLYDEWFPSEELVEKPQGQRLDIASPQIFLGYSREDVTVMRRVLCDLGNGGLSAWIDEGLEPGTPSWQEAIEKQIRQTQCMVVLLSPDAKASPWVSREITLAQLLGRRIFPVLVRGSQTTAIHFSLIDALYVDARKDYAEAIIGRLLPALIRYLQVVGTAPSESAREEPEERSTEQEVLPPIEKKSEPISEEVTTRASAGLRSEAVDDLDWVTIPAGDFTIGSSSHYDPDTSEDEQPQHTISLPTYQITRVPVTNAQYKQFVDATGHRAPSHWTNDSIPEGKGYHPIVNVTWRDAMAYCNWLSKARDEQIRLPTEAEWEKAARGDQDQRGYPWGDDAPNVNRCNFNKSIGDTTPVGAYPDGASPYGCLDMAGNVWEWTSSLYQSYPYNAADGREDANLSGTYVRRGGSWYSDPSKVRCAYRDWLSPGLPYWGFRLAKSSH